MYINAFLAIVRRIAFGGIIIFILSIFLRGEMIETIEDMPIYFPICVIVYLLFTLFTMISTNYMVKHVSSDMDLDLEKQNYIGCLFHCLIGDALSPIITLFGLFGDLSTKVFMFVGTYIILLAYIGIWFLGI